MTNQNNFQQHPASFKDPDGQIVIKDGAVYRIVNHSYKKDYDKLMQSGLYEELVSKNLLVEHEEIQFNDDGFYKLIKPEQVFISYPYEWSFSQYKDAAAATLNVQKTALKYGMTLKDASAYNIQFHKGKPLLIDTLSFEEYSEGSPWAGYKQFCQHFLSPLALMSYSDIRLSSLMKNYIDGIPLDLASRLLPMSSKLNLGLLMHIHFHSKTQKQYEHKTTVSKNTISKFQLEAIIDGLLSSAGSLTLRTKETEWEKYYTFTNYTDSSFEQKKKIIESIVEEVKPKTLWDLGGNTGVFSRLASGKGIRTVSFDIDPLAIESSYLNVKSKSEENILPLVMDLTNPSPSIGWASAERSSLIERAGNVDMVMALALVHHLAISNNLPLQKIASFFHSLSEYLVIEFVEKPDSQVQKLLSTREDIFDRYTKECFEEDFKKYFECLQSTKVDNMNRFIYLMKRK